MRISRLFLSRELLCGQSLALDDEDAHYIRTVLRLKKGDDITVFNGRGGEFYATIELATRKAVVISVGQERSKNLESSLRVSIGVAISRSQRMDLVMQKVVELGVNRITPLLSERCVVQLQAGRKEQKYRHWYKIIQHATEQCGRTVMPQLDAPVQLEEWLCKQEGLRFFFDPRATATLTQYQPEKNHVTLLTGPEGGFSEQERTNAKEAGFIPVRLGKRILRTETACLAALSAVQVLWGDFA